MESTIALSQGDEGNGPDPSHDHQLRPEGSVGSGTPCQIVATTSGNVDGYLNQKDNSVIGDGSNTVRIHTAKVDPHSREKMAAVPRFLIVEKNDGTNFDKDSPFKIANALHGLIGDTESIKKVKEGLLIKSVSSLQARRLLSIKRLCDSDINVRPHGSLNYCKGVISHPDLINSSVEEILDGLKSQGVTEVTRLRKKKDGAFIETAALLITFDKPFLPQKVKAAFYSLDVRPYYPKPIRCFRCQRFGHISNKCPNEELCKCGSRPHTGSPCEEPLRCINCGGNHSAISQKCPTLIRELKIQKMKVDEKLSYNDAKRKVINSEGPLRMTYAEATGPKDNTKSIVQELVPTISKIIEEQLTKSLQKLQTVLVPPSQRHEIRLDRPKLPREKRKRIDVETSSFYIESDDSRTVDDELAGPSTSADEVVKTKKKKGWPKGKPRKSKNSSQSESQIADDIPISSQNP